MVNIFITQEIPPILFLFCIINQLTGFYMMVTLAFNELTTSTTLTNFQKKLFKQISKQFRSMSQSSTKTEKAGISIFKIQLYTFKLKCF